MNRALIAIFLESMAWGLRGKTFTGDISGKRYARESFVAVFLGKEVIVPICYQGTMDATLFNDWL
jgi:isftu1 transposase